MITKCGGCKNENPRWVSWITGKMDTTQYCDKCGSGDPTNQFSLSDVTPQEYGNLRESIKISPGYLREIKSRQVRPDGSIKKNGKVFI